jgi:hypothetical protein
LIGFLFNFVGILQHLTPFIKPKRKFLMTTGKRWILNLITLSCLVISPQLFSEPSLRALTLEKATPDYVSNLLIEDQGEGVRITGSTANMQDVSRYMRFLENSVGPPNLVSMQRKDNRSDFILEIKKFKK